MCAFGFLGHSDRTISLSELLYCLSLGVRLDKSRSPLAHKPKLSGDIQLTIILLASVYAQEGQASSP